MISIHLMLRFISCNNCKTAFLIIISIHLMLRFINQATPTQLSSATFQYISCYGLSGYGRLTDKAQEHFNTSHVTVYLMFYLLFFFMRYNFNTSHVTVYLHGNGRMEYRTKFQYISCYGLSRFFLFIVLTLTKFQYISCYGLSADAPVDSPADFISIHLMLRFIFSHFAHSSEEYLFQYISCYGLSFPKSNRRRRKNNFNTSHVTVYQKSSISSTIRKTISIHLMLRFIPRRRQYKKAK